VGPEVLIVGDATRRADLLERIGGLGYRVSVGTGVALGQRIAERQTPAAVVVCTEDVDPRALMAELRGTRRGSGIPVTLHGPLGGRIGDLADVLDLGADHFLDEPADDEQLAAAMEELVGPGAPRPPARSSRSHHEASTSGGAPGAADGVTADGVTAEGATEVVLGQLHRTLDMLEERLKERDESDSGDELDLTALGFAELPDTGEESSSRSSGRGSSMELSLPHGRSGRSGRTSKREPTERLGLFARPESAVSVGPESSVAPEGPDRPRRRSPLPIDDEGTIDRLEVPRLLWTLHRAEYSGGLCLEHGRVRKRLWWRDGDIVFARSNVGHDRLIDGLLRRGLLTRDQYDTARRLAAKEPRRAGQLLVEAGFVKASELPRVLRNHLIRIIDSCFPWTDGRWSLEPEERSDESVLSETSVALVVAEGIRHRMESAQLTALLGGLDQYPRFREDAVVVGDVRALAERLLMSPSEEAWLRRLDGSRTLRELLDHPATDELELLGLGYMLHVLDYLELSTQEPGLSGGADPEQIDVARVRDRLRLAREADYFAMLGVPRDAARLDVRRAHAELSRTFDDDNLELGVRDDLAGELTELRTLLDEARDVLTDDTLRSAYLAHLEEP